MAVGTTYDWLDEDVRPGITYYYKLYLVDLSGGLWPHGPVPARIDGHVVYLPLVTR